MAKPGHVFNSKTKCYKHIWEKNDKHCSKVNGNDSVFCCFCNVIVMISYNLTQSGDYYARSRYTFL